MILCFPDVDTFHLAATGTLLPAELTLAPARVRFEGDGRIFLATDGKVSKKAAGDLTRLNVTTSKTMPGPAEELTCWLQALDAERDETPPLSTQAPVIFEVPEPALLPQLVGEMLRLGNDRQSYCWLEAGGERRVLLRVVGPPYYTLLQSLDPHFSGSARTLTAFVEQGPRVWVQIGYRHPVAQRIKLADDQMLLIRPGRSWTYLDNPPFRDIYDALQFPIAAAPTDWQPVLEPDKLTVPLKLAPGNSADIPEFWVLRSGAVEQLDAFVRDADDRLLQRLRFAVSEPQGGAERVIALRLSPSKLPPPALALSEAVGFKPYFKLINLFVPTGSRLHPQLRRDAVRTLLAGDPDRVVWLSPIPGGGFVPESIAEEAFRPLDHWVDYILESSPSPLKAWIAATAFDFESFICSDSADKPRGPARGPKDRGRGKETDSHSPLLPDSVPPVSEQNASQSFNAITPKPVDEAQRTDEWKIRRQALQDEFQKLDGGLDRPERKSLWPSLARANTGAGDPAEAAICWVNAMWEQESLAPELVRGWFQSEHPSVAAAPGSSELDALLSSQNPDRIEVRQLASGVLAALLLDPVPDWLRSRLPAIQHYLEANDAKLPVRAVWLLALEMAALTVADVLGLARVRDRILQRLLDSGLNAETDLPFFLRTAGLKDSERVRHVRDQAVALHALCRKWAGQARIDLAAVGTADNAHTLPYIDLLFSYAMAKIGESTAARTLLEAARKVMEHRLQNDAKTLTNHFLFQAFQYRIEEALAGKVPTVTLPRDLITAMDNLNALGKGVGTSPQGKAYYASTKMRQQSMILEPQNRPDAFASFMVASDEFLIGLKKFGDIRDPSEMARQVRLNYRGGVRKESRAELVVRFLTLHAAMPWAIRAGESFTVELLGLVPDVLKSDPVLGTVPDLNRKQGELLERSLFLAAHFDRRDLVGRLLDHFVELVGTKLPEQRFELVNFVAGQCLRSLRKLGLRDEIDRLLQRILALVVGGKSLVQLKSGNSAFPDQWWRALQSLLSLANGWLTFGNFDQANPILDEARTELLAPGQRGTNFPQAPAYTKLAQSYIAAVAQGSNESGLNRIVELFRGMDPSRVTVSRTTAPLYSCFHLAIVEEVVLAIASDEFALGPGGRRWLDEDEFLVRRRIHRDMQATLAKSRL